MAYDKHEWVTDEIITAALLNNIEDGIEAVDLALEDKQDASTALQIGTTSTTAKAGDYQPTWAQVSGKPSTFAPAAHTHEIADVNGLQGALDDKLDSADALEIGTTATTAAAGNHNHAIAADATSGLEAAANLQALAIALSARIKALEDAAE